MEGREGLSSSGVTVVGSDAPSNYHVAPRTTENPSQQVAGSAAAAAAAPVGVSPPPGMAAAGADATAGKKKRGRPRKYGPDGAVTMALSPKPISSAAPPPVIDFSAEKRGKVRAAGSVSKHKVDLDPSGEEANISLSISNCVYLYLYLNKVEIFGVWLHEKWLIWCDEMVNFSVFGEALN